MTDIQTLLERYGRAAVPRYTSYPTAPNFSSAVGEAEYRSWLGSLEPGTNGSLYVHIPFCRSMCWYCGCHTTITARSAPVERYLDHLARETAMVAAAIPHRLRLTHVHFGGGTPTLMRPAEMAAVMDGIRRHFDLASEAEVAIEVDPRTLELDMAAELGRQGFTRASIGVQSFDEAVQRAVNRVQSFAQTQDACRALRQSGVGSLNFDLLYGLPLQTERSCVETVAQALELRPDRLSVFGYAHVPSFKPHQRKIDSDALPDAGERLAQFEAIAGALGAAGYVRIGLDHFAHAEDGLAIAAREGRLRRNFQGYTTDEAPALVGLGASAIGRLPQGHVQNAVLISAWQQRIADGRLPVSRGYAITQDDRLRGSIIERLMCDYEVDVAAICARFGERPEPLMRGLPPLAADGLVELDGPVVRVRPEARAFLRSVAASFDAYLGTGAEQSGRHARAV